MNAFNDHDLLAPAEDNPALGDINMTPLVDVLLVLLVVFIVTLPAFHEAARIRLPSTAGAAMETAQVVRLGVLEDGRLEWNGAPISADALPSRLQAAARQSPQPAVHLFADRTVRYQTIAGLLADAEQAGIGQVAFVTSNQPTGAASK